MFRRSQVNVHVIGAGVIGLSTAVALQLKGFRVTVLAKHFPNDPLNIEYTSTWAGAVWQSLATNAYKRQQQFDGDTFKLFWKLARGRSDETGIMVIPAYNYYSNPTADDKEPWFKSFVPTFRVLGEGDALPQGATFGVHYTTNAMDDSVDAIINCSGMHARTLGGVEDNAVVPTRGQNVIVLAPHIRKAISYVSEAEDDGYYIIPRSDGTVILGTTHEEYNMDPTVNPASVEKVLAVAQKICPELVQKSHGTPRELEIVGHIVGVRPVRKGGPRVENEIMASPSGKRVVVTHNYGHGSFGHMSGWGAGLYAAQLVEKGQAQLQKEKENIITLFSRL
ncbi:hypothetical protein BDB00DRAFT_931583 [Zychaea mexicana]|uniref:uncharacterized protein n=1 Tax=Zychaea mexicana TaxID=64656 RepID=UPI0022FDC8FA|nr:uncharacterized protein BDB00DRAFT_931583 [Zychaea mexicana]KAI9489979.1 hypothetical protein BDB00DRAFT_931583 [Zychaea mexicana]